MKNLSQVERLCNPVLGGDEWLEDYSGSDVKQYDL
jgi:hypothetical protein